MTTNLLIPFQNGAKVPVQQNCGTFKVRLQNIRVTSVQAGTFEQTLHFWIFLGGRNEKAKAISFGAALIQPEMGSSWKT